APSGEDSTCSEQAPRTARLYSTKGGGGGGARARADRQNSEQGIDHEASRVHGLLSPLCRRSAPHRLFLFCVSWRGGRSPAAWAASSATAARPSRSWAPQPEDAPSATRCGPHQQTQEEEEEGGGGGGGGGGRGGG
ncbi:unnamed protein product, partial [Prorocentrum cordatum]